MSNSMSCCISINNHQLFLSLAGAVQNVLNMFCFDRGVNVVESRGLSFSLMCMYVYLCTILAVYIRQLMQDNMLHLL